MITPYELCSTYCAMLAYSTMYLFIKKLEHTYDRKRTMQGEDNCFTDQNSARMSLQTSLSKVAKI